MIDYDVVLKKLVKVWTKYQRPTGTCLSDELWTEYLENVLSPYKRRKVREHLISCNKCRKRSIILHDAREILTEESLLKAPDYLTQRAKDLVTTKSTIDNDCPIC